MKNVNVYLEDDLYKAVEKAANKYNLDIVDLLSECVEYNLYHYLKELEIDFNLSKTLKKL